MMLKLRFAKNYLIPNNRYNLLFFFQRFQFPDDKVPWSVDFPEYRPNEYTTTKIFRNPKADPSDPYEH